MSYADLLIWQYRYKPRAAATAQLLADTFTDAWRGLADLPSALSIEQAQGANLDLIGKHVGQSRVLGELAPRALFAFRHAPGGIGFIGGADGGGRWYRRGDPVTESVRLDDHDYRFLIKCRIARNYMTGTLENVSDMIEFIFDASATAYDQLDMSMTVIVPADAITIFKRYALMILDMLPRPAGVRIKFYTAVPRVAFGFRGAAGAAGFKEGVFARIMQ